MILCKKCGMLMGYNSYFGGYYCTSCDKLEVARKSTYPFVRVQTKRKDIRLSKMITCSKAQG